MRTNKPKFSADKTEELIKDWSPHSGKGYIPVHRSLDHGLWLESQV